MASERELAIKITGDARGLSRAFGRVQKDAGLMERGLGGVRRGMLNLGKAAAVATGALAVAGVAMGTKAANAASDLEEAINKTNEVFGDSSTAMKRWADDAAVAMGMTREQALEGASSLGSMLVPMGVAPKRAAEMSRSMTELASDMASFNNEDPSEMLDRIRAGLSGESEPLKRYGTVLSETRVQQHAWKEGLVATGQALTEEQKIQARYSLLLKDTAAQQGDFARTSDGMANASRIAKAQLGDLAATAGQVLVPVFADVLSAVNDVVSNLRERWPEIQATIEPVVRRVADVIAEGADWIRRNWDQISATAREVFATVADTIRKAVTAATPVLQELGRITRSVLELAMAAWDRFGEETLAVITTVFREVMRVVRPALQTLRSAIETVTAIIEGDWDKAWEGIKGILRNALKALVAAIRGIGSLIFAAMKFIAGKALEGLVGLPAQMIDAGKRIVQSIIDGIKAAPSAIIDAIVALVPNPVDIVTRAFTGGNTTPARAGEGGFTGLPSGSRGAMLPGTYQGVDTMIAAVAPGEAILTPRQQMMVDAGVPLRQALAMTGASFNRGGIVASAYGRAVAELGDPYGKPSLGQSRTGPNSWDCCLVGETRVCGPGGVKRMDELSSGDIVWSFVDGRRVASRVKAAWFTKRQTVHRVRTRSRAVLASDNHPFLRAVCTEPRGGGRGPSVWGLEWARTDELRPGDLLVQAGPTGGGREEIDRDTAWLMGLIVGDGSITGADVRICVYDDTRERADLIIRELTGLAPAWSDKHGLRVSSRALSDLLASHGLEAAATHQKRVPDGIWSAHADSQRSFLDGYCAADGHRPADTRRHGERTYASASPDLIADVRALHISLGDPVSNITVNRRRRPITINARVVKRARPLHGFAVWPVNGRDGMWAIRRHQALAHMLSEWGGEFILTRVLEVTEEGEADTYDIEVEGAHNFTADGLVVHNSGYATHVAQVNVGGTTASAYPMSSPRRGGELIAWGFRKNHSGTYRGGYDEHMGVFVNGRWFDAGSGGVESNADSARWQEVRIPRGLEGLTVQSLAGEGQGVGPNGEDTATATRGRGSPKPLNDVQKLAKLLGEATGRRGLGEGRSVAGWAKPLVSALRSDVPDVSSSTTGTAYTGAQGRAISGAARAARTEARVAGQSPEQVREAGEKAEREAELKVLRVNRREAIQRRARLGKAKGRILTAWRKLTRKPARTPKARAARKKATASIRVKLREFTAEINDLTEIIAEIAERMREIGEEAIDAEHQANYAAAEQAALEAEREAEEATRAADAAGDQGPSVWDQLNAEAAMAELTDDPADNLAVARKMLNQARTEYEQALAGGDPRQIGPAAQNYRSAIDRLESMTPVPPSQLDYLNLAATMAQGTEGTEDDLASAMAFLQFRQGELEQAIRGGDPRQITTALQNLLAVQQQIRALTENTDALDNNTEAMQGLTGSVTFGFRGQDYVLRSLAPPSSDRIENLLVGA